MVDEAQRIDKYHYLISGNKSEQLFVKAGSHKVMEISFVNILGFTVVANLKFNIYGDSIVKRAKSDNIGTDIKNFKF